jgi:two-component system nitrate/nitrite sensor histidine kinase NarX
LSNIARHAHARSVRMTLESGPPVRLQIIDDGQGFDPARVADGHLGLVSIHERAAAINASVMIMAAAGQGTRIVVQWPASDAQKRGNDDED